jgi:hypothetical protein
MLKKSLVVCALLVASSAVFANSNATVVESGFGSAVYYVGEKAALTGESQECFAEVKYSTDKQSVEVRALILEGYGESFIGVGPVVAKYGVIPNFTEMGYYYEDSTGKEPVGALALVSPEAEEPSDIFANVLHIDHYHSASCDSLVLATGVELTEAQEAFENFQPGEIEDEEGHDHDHDHGHSHNH